MNQRVFFFDLLRCVAAVAVIAIHVLAPYRNELGVISFSNWATAVSVNSVSRWAVPVFIMISGALLLSDARSFNFKYYVQRRLGKVFIPFVVWSLFYAYLSGWTSTGFDSSVSQQVLSDSLHHETYYHLGFFYYFIPLYLLIPFYQIFVRKIDDTTLYVTVVLWLLCTTLFLFGIDGPWSNQYFLYSGYLLLGYVCYQKVPLTSSFVVIFALMGILALLTTVGMVIGGSLGVNEYTVGRWLSYKTLNTVLAASMLFMVCRFYGERLSGKVRKVVGFISTYSLGIYILHPIFLWPMKNYGWYQGHSAWVIPLWIVLSGAGALGLSWLIARSSKTRWLLP
ncbi:MULTISPECIES: acyltransferase [Vibrio]|uniref:acyltransferase n=1 Tax=Vibrio TaxID=662 RepID=UPI000B5CE3B4|nr:MULTISPECIES: acyltransferase [Vibrio]HBV76540.1 acyltransferase [Vibrio sp.]